MEKIQKIRITSALVFVLTVILFLSFYIYLGVNENVSVYSPRHSPYYGQIINLTPETVADDSAPMGERTVYSWLMDAHCETGDYLCFYVSNHHVEVLVDGEVIYSLHSSNEDPVARSVSSNWCIIPLEPEDAGKQFTVQLIPLVAEVMHQDVEILIGSNYNIILEELRGDTLQMVLSMLCIALGLIIILIQGYLQIFSGASQWDILFLGVFSVILGIWRITAIRSAPLIFSGNPKLLGYVSVGMLFLGSPAMLQVISAHYRAYQTRRIHVMSMMFSAAGLFVLASQVFGVMDMEESRAVSYVILGTGILMVIITSTLGRKADADNTGRISWKFLPLLAVGIILDVAVFYFSKSSSDLMYTSLLFLVFLSITFISSFRETSKMVYRDSRTGLFNKARWNEMMQMDARSDGFTGILTIDMNGLKRVNDTLGHDAGDRMIVAFAEILKNSLPSSCVIFRWGGDEFSVLFPNITRNKMDQYTEDIRRATEEYNLTDPEVKIYFAMGEALSEEHPEMSRPELFRLADEIMYRSKQLWYAEKKTRETDKD